MSRSQPATSRPHDPSSAGSSWIGAREGFPELSRLHRALMPKVVRCSAGCLYTALHGHSRSLRLRKRLPTSRTALICTPGHSPCRIWRKPLATTGQGGPSGVARGETAQVLTVASGRSADRSRATAMGRRPDGGRWPCRAGRRGLPGGASSPARQGVTGSPRSLRIFADHLSGTAQVTDAGRLTCAGAAGEPRLAPLRRPSVGLPVNETHRQPAVPPPGPKCGLAH